jgi:hypothetical protein
VEPVKRLVLAVVLAFAFSIVPLGHRWSTTDGHRWDATTASAPIPDGHRW